MQDIVLSKEEIIKVEIITVSQRLFQRFGYKKTTMEDIAKALGKGKSTLYYYYKSKDVIFADVIGFEAAEIMKKVERETEKCSTATEKLKAYLKVFFDEIRNKINFYELIRLEMLDNFEMSAYKPAIDFIYGYQEKNMIFLVETLLAGIENNEFDPSLKDDVNQVAYTLMSAIRVVILDLSLKNHKVEDFSDVLMKILLKGLRP